MIQRCADQDDQKHVTLRLIAGVQCLLGWLPHPNAPCHQGAAVMPLSFESGVQLGLFGAAHHSNLRGSAFGYPAIPADGVIADH